MVTVEHRRAGSRTHSAAWLCGSGLYLVKVRDYVKVRVKGTEHRVPELIPVLGSQPAGDVSHKRGGSLPLLSARPAVTLATIKRAATNFAAW